MNLEEHKQRLYEYEQLLTEIAALRHFIAKKTAWSLVASGFVPEIGDYEVSIQVSADESKRRAGELLHALEKQAAEEARLLGIEA